MQYIRCQDVEFLLKNYRLLKGLFQSLRLEIRRTRGGINKDDYIESMVFKKTQPGDIKIYSKGKTSDKTGNTALSYEQQAKKETDRLLKELKDELLLLDTTIGKIEISYKMLPEELQQIIKLRYYENLTSYQVEYKLLLSKYQVNERRKQALKQMQITSRITINDYNKVVKILKT